MTKSPHTGQSEGAQSCAASVEYKGRRGACRREGKHPDSDGIRWWCGLHTPNRKAKAKAEAVSAGAEVETVKTVATVAVKPAAAPKVALDPAYGPDGAGKGRVVDMGVLVSASQAQVADSKAIQALEDARGALIEISNTNTQGWDASKPVENYKILIMHMADRAREASERLTAALLQLRS